MKKMEFNFNREMNLGMARLRRLHPELSEEQVKIMALQEIPERELDVYRVNICRKMMEVYGCDNDFAIRKTERLMENMPRELLQNIEEWLDDEPISDVVIGEVSVKMIMEQHKEDGIIHNFIDSLFVMKDYVNSGCVDSYSCFHIFNTL